MKRSLVALAGLLAVACSGEASQSAATSPIACGLPDAQRGAFVSIPEGGFEKGANAIYPEEQPTTRVQVAAFRLQTHEVTNAQFEQFVTATGYVTDAERSAASADSGGGSALFVMPANSDTPGTWVLSRGATWKTPDGPSSGIAKRMHEPVTHVSLNDARAYAQWAGGRLPLEEEWEYAAALGLVDRADPISGAYDAEGKPIANTWQGLFPVTNETQDGFAGPAPVGCFQPSKIGLYDMMGNVWEWTETPYAQGMNTIKGGSYLCAENFCKRYRAAARQGQEIDFSSNHIGFRIAKDVTQ
jgi:sulfatase modifying factor 1